MKLFLKTIKKIHMPKNKKVAAQDANTSVATQEQESTTEQLAQKNGTTEHTNGQAPAEKAVSSSKPTKDNSTNQQDPKADKDENQGAKQALEALNKQVRGSKGRTRQD
ncbi:MAG: hypothetical protein IPN76_23595 [Saprospiraceae bacterium]|nr:hypothetical protein [Saprospiraceae bacterium]